MLPQCECVTDVSFGLVDAHAGDGAQVLECGVSLATHPREPEMRGAVAVTAQTDQPAQRLGRSSLVIGPAFVGFQPPFDLAVLTPLADFALVARAAQQHPPQTFPVALSDAGADVGEPARTGYEIHKQSGAECPIFLPPRVSDIFDMYPGLRDAEDGFGYEPDFDDPDDHAAGREKWMNRMVDDLLPLTRATTTAATTFRFWNFMDRVSTTQQTPVTHCAGLIAMTCGNAANMILRSFACLRKKRKHAPPERSTVCHTFYLPIHVPTERVMRETRPELQHIEVYYEDLLSFAVPELDVPWP